jgi:hypothetical protein
VDDDIRREVTDDFSPVVDLDLLLHFELKTSIRQFDDQSILVNLFIESRLHL